MANNPNSTLSKILQAVQTASTLTAVAKWLYMSQPNVSKAITDAEKKYGTKLVNRNQTPISLTPAGEELLKRLHQILFLEQQTLDEMKTFQSNKQRKINVAFFPTYSSIFLPKIYSNLIGKYSDIVLNTQSLTTSEALKRLKNRQVDIFFGRNVDDPEVISLPLFTEQLCFVISKEHPLYQKDDFERQLTNQDLLTLQKSNYINWSKETSFIDVTQHFFLLNGLNFESNLTVDTYEEAMLCAAQGLGITMAMKKTAEFFLKNQAVNLLVVPTKMASLAISTMVLRDARRDVIQFNEEIADSLKS